jgi:hypothetical protein
MNKNEAIKKVKSLQQELDFDKEKHQSEIQTITKELDLYKYWFKTAQKEIESHIKKINEQYRELKDYKEINNKNETDERV